MKNPEKLIFYFFPLLFIYIAIVGILIPKASLGTKIGGSFFFLYTLFLVIKYVKISNFKAVYLYTLYLFILILFSSKFAYSLKSFLTLCIPLFIFTLSYTLINKIEKIKKLYFFLFVLMIFYLLNILIANIFHLGGTAYSENSIEIGNVFTEGLNSMAYLTVALPIIIYFYPSKRKEILIIGVLIMLLVIVQMKRISILAMFFGFLCYLILYKRRMKAMIGIFTGIVIFSIFFQFFDTLFYQQLESREKKLQIENLENEGRYQETGYIIDEIIYSNDISLFLFGKELFNSPGNFANGYFNERQIHSDYNELLHGSGVFGLLFYLFMQSTIYHQFLRLRKKLNRIKIKHGVFDLINYLFPAFFFMGFVIMLSGGIYSPLFNSVRYVVLGSTLGYLNNLYLQEKKKRATLNIQQG